MASETEGRAERRAPLSTDKVLRAAIGVADEGGLEALSMRRLARELGVEVMSLYYYVAKKDDLLDGIVDVVVGEMEAASDGADWKAAIRSSAISAHEVLERHPWACGLMMSPARVGPSRMRFMDSLLGSLRRAGFSAELTDLAYHALDSHIIGSTLWEVGYSTATGDSVHVVSDESLGEFAANFLRSLPVDEYPYLVEHVQQHMGLHDAGESSYEFGLDLILDGLERMRFKG
jgi:AcrR family transcriptional regulator